MLKLLLLLELLLLLKLLLLLELLLLLKLLLLMELQLLKLLLLEQQTLKVDDLPKYATNFVFFPPSRVIPPFEKAVVGPAELSAEEVARMGDVRALVGQLYEALHVEEHQVRQSSLTL